MNVTTLLQHFAAAALIAVVMPGCATRPATKPAAYTFFPPAPDEPRLQFLTSFSSDADVGRRSGFADFITGDRTGPIELIKPYGVAMHQGKAYVCDTIANAIQIFDFARSRSYLLRPRAEGRLLMPINVKIDDDGTRYVADTGRNQVVIYDSDDSYVGAIGVRDEMRPSDVAISKERLYVADLKGHSVRVYDKAQRKLLFTIPREATVAEGKLFSPANLALDQTNGRLLVSDIGGFNVQVYDLDGKFLRTIGKQGVAPGMFARPKGVAVDRAGRAYVVDAFVATSGPSTQVVQIFDAEGRLLLYFGQPGASAKGELLLPAGVAIDYDSAKYFQQYVAPGYQCEYLVLVTSQLGPNKVNVYGFLKKK